MLRGLPDHPRLLEGAYRLTHRLLSPFRPWLKPHTRLERWLARLEKSSKGAIFNCHMCGQCILHSTGMTCPMTCPKELRNGPCGGVRQDGRCEVHPERACVWVQAWERSRRMAWYGDEILLLQPPVDRRLHRTSAWVNDFTGEARRVPTAWQS